MTHIKLPLRDVGSLLNRATIQLDGSVLEQLRKARQNALQHQIPAQRAPVLAWLSHHGLVHHRAHKALNLGMATLLTLILLGGAVYWQYNREPDHSDIDIAILTDELPIDMYVDD